jgi:hypothetical protein
MTSRKRKERNTRKVNGSLNSRNKQEEDASEDSVI